MKDSIAQEIQHLTGRLDAIIREQAGERVLHHLDQIRQLAVTSRHHGDRTRLRGQRALIDHLSVAEAAPATAACAPNRMPRTTAAAAGGHATQNTASPSA